MRRDTYARDIELKLEEVRERARGWDFGLFGGDWSHWNRPSRALPEFIYRSLTLLSQWPTPLFFTVGNHDLPPAMMDAFTESALGAILKGLDYDESMVQLLREAMTHDTLDQSGPAAVGRGDTTGTARGALVHLSPAHWHKDIDTEEGRAAYAIGSGDWGHSDLTIKIAHGMIVPPTFDPPFDATPMDQIDTTGIDVLLHGHSHWTTPPQMVNGTLFISPGAIARCSRDEADRVVCVAEVDVRRPDDRGPATSAHSDKFTLRSGLLADVRYVPLESARPAGEVFEAAPVERSNDGGDKFAGYAGMLEAYGGSHLDPLAALDALAVNAPPEVLAYARRRLIEAGG